MRGRRATASHAYLSTHLVAFRAIAVYRPSGRSLVTGLPSGRVLAQARRERLVDQPGRFAERSRAPLKLFR